MVITWVVGLRPETGYGDAHGTGVPASRVHTNVAPAGAEEKAKVVEVASSQAPGPLVSVVSGAGVVTGAGSRVGDGSGVGEMSGDVGVTVSVTGCAVSPVKLPSTRTATRTLRAAVHGQLAVPSVATAAVHNSTSWSVSRNVTVALLTSPGRSSFCSSFADSSTC